jgi:hypothetical protein
MKKKISKTERLIQTLRTGKELTSAQVEKFGFASADAIVGGLRNWRRIAVYANQRTLRDGSRVVKYRIGMPTQAMQEQGFTA